MLKRFFSTFLSPLFLILILFSFTFISFCALADQKTATLIRSADSKDVLSLVVSKDIYGTLYRNEQYLVSIPHETEETYYESVPVDHQEYVCDPAPDPTPENPNPSQNCYWKTVTTYEDQRKTRIVTTYTYEWQCCESVPYEGVVYTWELPLEVKFPADAPLRFGESEEIHFTIAGTEKKPSVTIDPSDAIYRYKIINKTVTGSGSLAVELATYPFLTDKTAGAASIGKAVLDFQTTGAAVVIQDKVTNPRVESSYKIQVLEKGSTVVIGETNVVTRDGQNVHAQVLGTYDPEKNYVVKISVVREGVIIVGNRIAFDLVKTIPAEKVDSSELADQTKIGKYSWLGEKETSLFRFRDRSTDYYTVQTKYAFKVTMKIQGKPVVLATGEINRSAVERDADGRMLIPVKKILNPADEALAKMVRGSRASVDITVIRATKRYGTPTFHKEVEMEIEGN